jgi:hypothetical protein
MLAPEAEEISARALVFWLWEFSTPSGRYARVLGRIVERAEFGRGFYSRTRFYTLIHTRKIMTSVALMRAAAA